MTMKLLVRRARRNIPDMAIEIISFLIGGKPVSVWGEMDEVSVGWINELA